MVDEIHGKIEAIRQVLVSTSPPKTPPHKKPLRYLQVGVMDKVKASKRKVEM